jgi:hypothetical protein
MCDIFEKKNLKAYAHDCDWGNNNAGQYKKQEDNFTYSPFYASFDYKQVLPE